MGYNSTVLVLNDALNEIANDPQFGKNLADAIQRLSLSKKHRGKYGVDIGAGNHANAATAIETHHADGNAIVAVGGNYASVMGYTAGTHHQEGDKLSTLKSLARELGYSLRKNTSRDN